MKKLHVVGMDQLNLELHPEDATLVFIESYAELRRRPYHKTRLAFLMTNYRHFAAECEESGRDVRYLKTQKPIHEALKELEPSQLTMVEPAERELLQSLDDLISSGALTLLPHSGWLTTAKALTSRKIRRSLKGQRTRYKPVGYSNPKKCRKENHDANL